MEEESRDEGVTEASTEPLDDFPAGQGREDQRRSRLAPLGAALTLLSAVALVFAFASASGIVLLDALHWIRPELSWKVKSALPLIGIGVSYASLQFTLPRTWRELCLSVAVSLAFILWGAEQFIPVPRIASMVDDLVVFLFVLDLGIVIRGRLRQSMSRRRSGSKG